MCFLFVGGDSVCGDIFMPWGGGDEGLCWYNFFPPYCVVLTVSNPISIILLQGDYICKGLGPSSIFMIRNKFSFLHKIERPA